MDTQLSRIVEEAARQARRRAASYNPPTGADALPWTVIKAFDDTVRANVERDRRIEDERDRVLIAAVRLAETAAENDEEIEEARESLVEAIDFLEQSVLRFGAWNGRSDKFETGKAK